jgi:5'-methylthioadenosine phosphorylase
MLGIIGGTGFYQLDGVTVTGTEDLSTPFGPPSAPITRATYKNNSIAFLPRHGAAHDKLPHEINYRANIYALKKIGVTQLISVSAVGSLRANIAPGHMVVPNQYIDRIMGPRVKTFLGDGVVGHVSTARPVCPDLSRSIAMAAKNAGATVHENKTYIAVDGPRFGTAAESHMMRGWGADIIGMTAIPEVFLAREAQMAYAALCIATDYDAWQDDPNAHAAMSEILAQYKTSLATAQRAVLSALEASLPASSVLCRTALSGAIMTDIDHLSPAQRALYQMLAS